MTPVIGQPKICCKTLYDSDAITKIYKLVNEEEQIDIIVTHWDCAIASIPQFHSTVVMSYIKADSIVIMYPEWIYDRKPESFVHSRSYMEGKTNTRTIEALMKYTERGFKFGHYDHKSGEDSLHGHLKEGKQKEGRKGTYDESAQLGDDL
ncbi:hypothetical protein BDR06DRAFT_968004 [Suillus hirtellus]|nr:hypothetical protein BDR06DRAFT_968004 [Suillus hirtellus]